MERLINESASSTTVSELCAEYRANNQITKDEYELYHVKRGLRNRDGTGVMAGLTHVCNVHGYLISDGVKIPDSGPPHIPQHECCGYHQRLPRGRPFRL